VKNWSWHRFGYGVIGAAAPEIVRMVKTVDLAGPPHINALAVIISIVFLFLGGSLAVAWDDDSPIKCIYVGSTFPIWFSAWAHIAVAHP
jgi:hypothetical protein